MEVSIENKKVLDFIVYCIDFIEDVNNKNSITKDHLVELTDKYFKESFNQDTNIYLKKNNYGNLWHEFSQIVFDPKTSYAIGFQDNDKISKMKKKHLILCENNNWHYTDDSYEKDINLNDIKIKQEKKTFKTHTKVLEFLEYCIDFITEKKLDLTRERLIVLGNLFFKEERLNNPNVYTMRNKDGNLVHKLADIVFDKKNGCVIGIEEGGKLKKMRKKHILICESNGWFYKKSCIEDTELKRLRYAI